MSCSDTCSCSVLRLGAAIQSVLTRIGPWLLVAAVLAVGVFAATPASAQTCFADTGGLPGGISCTANDVQTSLIVTPNKVCSLNNAHECSTDANCAEAGEGTCGADTCTGPNDTITLDMRVTWHANS